MGSGGKSCRVIVSDEAAQMLVAHARFLAQVSETAAHQLISEFGEKAKSLESFPERNPWLSDPLVPSGKYRKLLLAKRYLLFYWWSYIRLLPERIIPGWRVLPTPWLNSQFQPTILTALSFISVTNSTMRFCFEPLKSLIKLCGLSKGGFISSETFSI